MLGSARQQQRTTIGQLSLIKELRPLALQLRADAFNAFAEAKRVYIDQLKNNAIASPSKADETNRKVMEMVGDPLPYGIEPNRHMLENLLMHAKSQQILKHPVDLKKAFAASTHDLVA